MLTLEKFEEATELVKKVTNPTKLIYSDFLSEQSGGKVYLKPENMQHTGAYKIRGAYYKISTLSEEERERGLITASAGNHAQGVAFAAKKFGCKATIVMPTVTPLIKVNRTKSYGAEVVLHGDVYDDAYDYACELAEKNGYTFVHPFNDLDVATAFGCPFEGKYEDTSAAVKFLKDYVDAGMTTCCLCDTIGIADPRQVKELIGELKAAYPDLALMVHFHDTRGLGMVNTIAAMESGVTCVQSALGGLGGCPFAPGASGNLSTEDMIWMLNEMGYDTGVEFSKILEAAKFQVEKIPGNYSGHHIHIETPTPCKY